MKKEIFTVICVLLCNSIFSQSAKIPFEFYQDTYVLIKLSINNKDTLCFYFDTGATATLVDSTVAKKIGLIPNYEQNVSGAGGNKKYKIALNQTVNVEGNLKIDGIHIVIDDLSRLQRTLGRKFDGIIGYSILKDFKTKIDFDFKTIELLPFSSKVNLDEYHAIDFKFGNGIPIPQFPITIMLKNNKKYTDTVFFDSGAGLSLLVNTPFKIKTNLSNEIGTTLTSKTDNLSTQSVIQDGIIRSLQIGKFVFGEHPISLSSDKEGVSAYENYLGILGNEIISRFNIVADYSAKKIYLKPNTYFNKPFEFDLSGIKLKLESEQVTIASIFEESLAYREGIREGDVIVSINGLEKMPIETYRDMLKKDNSTVVIKCADRKGIVKMASIKLKRLI